MFCVGLQLSVVCCVVLRFALHCIVLSVVSLYGVGLYRVDYGIWVCIIWY